MSAVADAARQLIGKPFRHQARGPDYYDCAGVCMYAFRVGLGVVVPDRKGYPRFPGKRNLLQLWIEELFGAPVTGPRAGDVALMKFRRLPHHVAIVGNHPDGGLSLIHTTHITGKVVEQRMDERLRADCVAFYRWGPV